MKCINDVILNDLQALKRITIEYPKYENRLRKEFNKVSSERQDLLHVIELGKLDAIQFGKVSRELKEVQIKRRELKNELEIFEELNRHFNIKKPKSDKYDFIIKRIEDVFGKIKNRKYTMRVREDLQKLVE